MNNDKAFISLLTSFLNSNKPELEEAPDWSYIYNLANIHNVLAIIAHEASLLPNELRPDGKIMSMFKQQLGYTIIEFDKRSKAKEFITKILDENNIEFILLKGAVLSDCYPVPEYRTSGDIDIVIRNDALEKCRTITDKLSEDGIITYSVTGHQYEISINYNGCNIEIHTDKDLHNSYFENIFALAEQNKNEYKLDDTLHLAYVICHIAKHFRHQGAGIRMFMDIDVLARRLSNNNDNAINDVIEICKKSGYEKFANACLSICKVWFGTPVSIDYDIRNDERLTALFENEVITAGTFGNANMSDIDYYAKSGLMYYLFPSINQMRLRYKFLEKHSFLLPAAWIMRIFEGFFKRNNNSISTVKTIIKPNKNTKEYIELINELNI